jgi:formylglycine-generating enzyme required for sulfatase activity
MNKLFILLLSFTSLFIKKNSDDIKSQREQILNTLKQRGLSDIQIEKIMEIFNRSPLTGDGVPSITSHPMTVEQCKINANYYGGFIAEDKECGFSYMKKINDTTCIDQFEFPGVPCEYPLTWITVNSASDICHVMGGRLPDAHESEGACAGEVLDPNEDYNFNLSRRQATIVHNSERKITYGLNLDNIKCATSSNKSPKCNASEPSKCGSNSFPSGSFPKCVSPLGIYDLIGNVAEMMNLPLSKNQLKDVGETELKFAWFAFDKLHPHLYDCRWRAPSWHASKINEKKSHANYHLGFRCVKDIK